jgi:hypothetical protein
MGQSGWWRQRDGVAELSELSDDPFGFEQDKVLV